jgi:MIP family channel proteins
MEAAGLGIFMISACVGTVILEHPASPIRRMIPDAIWRRAALGALMAATAMGAIYSPWGQQSGAHLNPAVTLSYLRLKKIARVDALFYIVAQFLGGLAGVLLTATAFGDGLSNPTVNFAATVPGAYGPAVAFVAEVIIACLMMSVILISTNHARLSSLTGIFAGLLVGSYVTFEAPLSGFSMNPARSFASALPAESWRYLWIYFVAPPLGMLAVSEVWRRLKGMGSVRCAKLNHHTTRRCIFDCGYTTRTLPTALCLIVLGFLAGEPQVALAGPLVSQVDSVGVTVSDAEAAAEFYSKVLSFERVSEVELSSSEVEALDGVRASRLRNVRLKLGSEYLDLMQYLGTRGRAFPLDSHSNDHWFQHIAVVVSDMDRAYQTLQGAKVRFISSAPQRLPDWNTTAAGIEAFYFSDPDGHTLELIHFPRGKGDAKWHAPSTHLFLGIDHTAIVAGDTDRSLRFYRDVLGLRFVGQSENYGIEQERLNNVDGARLRITSLRAKAGPGVELLEYLAPTDGRPFPSDESSNDLINWQIRMLTAEKDTANLLRALRIEFVSPATLSIDERGLTRALTLRDPDGHQIQLIER